MNKEQWAELAKKQARLQKVNPIVRRVRKGMKPSYELIFTSYDDQLTDEQVALLLSGQNPWEHEPFARLEEWEGDQRWEAAQGELKELVGNDDMEVLSGSDEEEELRMEIMERDTSDIIDMLLRTTPALLMRYDLDCDVSTTWSSTEQERLEQAEQIIEALGLDPAVETGLRERIAGDLLPEASSGGRAWILWHGDPQELYTQLQPYWRQEAPTATVTFSARATLLVLDKLNGSGHEMTLDREITVSFDAANLTTDKGDTGYGWDEICGLVGKAYEADVTITVQEEISV